MTNVLKRGYLIGSYFDKSYYSQILSVYPCIESYSVYTPCFTHVSNTYSVDIPCYTHVSNTYSVYVVIFFTHVSNKVICKVKTVLQVLSKSNQPQCCNFSPWYTTYRNEFESEIRYSFILQQLFALSDHSVMRMGLFALPPPINSGGLHWHAFYYLITRTRI